MKKCVIIMNPESGKRKKIKSYQTFYDVLRKHGYDVLTSEQLQSLFDKLVAIYENNYSFMLNSIFTQDNNTNESNETKNENSKPNKNNEENTIENNKENNK